MSIINLEIHFFMTREIYVSRELPHPLHYQSLHSLPTVPQYSQISHCFFFYFFSLLTWHTFKIPPYHLSNLLQPLSIFLLHIKCMQHMQAQWAQHFQRPRIYHDYSYYTPFSLNVSTLSLSLSIIWHLHYGMISPWQLERQSVEIHLKIDWTSIGEGTL